MTQQTIEQRRMRFHYRRMLGVVMVASGLLFAASTQIPASAQSFCGERADVAMALADKFNEAPVAAGLSQLGEMIEVFSSIDGTTWTLVVTKPDGERCLVAAGEAWLSLIRKTSGPEV